MLGIRGTAQHAATSWALLKKPVITKEDAFQFCNANLPKDAVVALLFEWSSTEVERKQILGSIEDHIPTRHFLLRNIGREAQALIEAGATHAIIRETLFLQKTYPFLSAEKLDQDFHVPVSNLNRSLETNAILLHQTRTHRVYRLEASP